MDPALIGFLKEGGLLLWAGAMTWWALTLWRKLEAQDVACQACQKAHNERLVTVTNGSIRAIEQSTAAIAAANRQEEIIKLLQRDSRSQRAPGPSL